MVWLSILCRLVWRIRLGSTLSWLPPWSPSSPSSGTFPSSDRRSIGQESVPWTALPDRFTKTDIGHRNLSQRRHRGKKFSKQKHLIKFSSICQQQQRNQRFNCRQNSYQQNHCYQSERFRQLFERHCSQACNRNKCNQNSSTKLSQTG